MVTYDTIPEVFSGDADGVESDLNWGNPSAGDPGVPGVGNTVVLDGVTGILPVTKDGKLDLSPSASD